MKKEVKIYTTKTCPYCKMAKDFFNENKIQYKEIDVSSDIKSAQEIVKKTGQMGVPVISVGEKIVVGFDKAELKKLLKLK